MANICYNCWLKATTKDHCPPKFIYSRSIPFPKNLKTVPSCKECNNGMAMSESIFFGYFCALMSKEKFIEYSPRGIKSNKKISQDIASNFIPGTNAIYIPKEKVHNVLVKIIKGLFYLKFKSIFPEKEFSIRITQNNLGQNSKEVEFYKNIQRKVVQEWIFDYAEDFTEDGEGKIILNFFDEIFVTAENI